MQYIHTFPESMWAMIMRFRKASIGTARCVDENGLFHNLNTDILPNKFNVWSEKFTILMREHSCFQRNNFYAGVKPTLGVLQKCISAMAMGINGTV